MAISIMTPANRLAWAAMRSRLWDQLPVDEHLIDIDRMLARAHRRLAWIAVDPSGKSAGFAEASIRAYVNGCTAEPVPFLEGVWVEPQFRRAGVARDLVRAVEAWAKSDGFIELCSDADIDNHDSHAAHAGWGFAETQRAVYFRKPLK